MVVKHADLQLCDMIVSITMPNSASFFSESAGAGSTGVCDKQLASMFTTIFVEDGNMGFLLMQARLPASARGVFQIL